jgi:hypothetical protein
MYLYYICNGDAILMSPDGRVGRYSHDIGLDDAPGYNRPCAVDQCAKSFDEFVDRYVAYLGMTWEEQKHTVFSFSYTFPEQETHRLDKEEGRSRNDRPSGQQRDEP